MTTLSTSVVGADGETDLSALRTSARGWHGVQLAVLGFIGLCGAINSIGSNQNPEWLELLAGLLVLASLGLACVATVLVASAAWPVQRSGRPRPSAELELHRTERHLRSGIILTFVAVVVLAVATGSSWWPSPRAPGNLVELSTAGGSVCGTLQESATGTVSIEASGQRFDVRVSEVVSLRPTGACPSD